MSTEEENIRIKDYQIHLPPLGEGTYGRVYRATYRGISDRALKIFRPGAVDLSTMSRELEKLSIVAEHNGIVTLHDFNLLNEPPYYAMGLHADQNTDGTWETRTLERLCGHVDHREAWRLIREIAEALAYLHRNQIIHCDIKPSNILLTDDTPFHIKICDFGQSRGLAGEGFEPAGTPLYASPDQLRNPRDSADGKGFRWDVYSFGVVAYKMYTGQLPRLKHLGKTERKSFDPEATIHEATLEATLAESGNGIDGEQLATLTEAVEDIEWPEEFYIPSDRKELIERCLSLDPMERPADMRAVRNLVQDLDQQQVMKRARRLNSIFATLLVIAIWASGFAFVQAKRARDTNVELQRQTQHATDLALPFVNELLEGDITVERIHSIIGDNAEAFLASLPTDDQSTERALRLSAQSASIRGRQAFNREDYVEALEKYTSAYEIRSQLAESSGLRDELEFLASRDLLQIGSIHEALFQYEEAVSSYTKALDLRRGRDTRNQRRVSLPLLRERLGIHESISRVQASLGDTEAAIKTLQDLFENYVETAPNTTTDSRWLGYASDRLGLLNRMGDLHLQNGNEADALETFRAVEELASEVMESPSPSAQEEARVVQMAALHRIGDIHYRQQQLDMALQFYRDEIKLREISSRARPFDAELRLATADAYSSAARCYSAEDPTSRNLALIYLDQSLSLVASLPPSYRNSEETQEKVKSYNAYRSQLLEYDE